MALIDVLQPDDIKMLEASLSRLLVQARYLVADLGDEFELEISPITVKFVRRARLPLP